MQALGGTVMITDLILNSGILRFVLPLCFCFCLPLVHSGIVIKRMKLETADCFGGKWNQDAAIIQAILRRRFK